MKEHLNVHPGELLREGSFRFSPHTTAPIHSGWLLIGYLLVGGIWAVATLSTSGDRFAAFVIYGLYAMPSTMLVSAIGLGDALFSDWPTAVYWTSGLVVVNGVAIYALAKAIASSWRRGRKPCAPKETAR